jgi:hypothetical protein
LLISTIKDTESKFSVISKASRLPECAVQGTRLFSLWLIITLDSDIRIQKMSEDIISKIFMDWSLVKKVVQYLSYGSIKKDIKLRSINASKTTIMRLPLSLKKVSFCELIQQKIFRITRKQNSKKELVCYATILPKGQK